MKALRYICLFFLCFLTKKLLAQQADSLQAAKESMFEQGLETIAEQGNDWLLEDDAYQNYLRYLLRHPLNINKASTTQLENLHLLTPIQIHSLQNYIQTIGLLTSLYELQAVPYWNVTTIQKVIPYITIDTENNFSNFKVKELFKKADKQFLIRLSSVLPLSKGYTDSLGYIGSPLKNLLRIRLVDEQRIYFSFLAEHDAGEPFLQNVNRTGFDFYSYNLTLTNLNKWCKKLFVGDYALNIHQGLTQWMSLAFTRSADAMAIKREGDVIKPYTSTGEINFHRGLAFNFTPLKNWEISPFISYKKIDANVERIDSLQSVITSFKTSGLHRTQAELAEKKTASQLAYGLVIAKQLKNVSLSMAAIHYKWSYPIQKSNMLYNKFTISGTGWRNYSLATSYTYKNLHWFAEFALTHNFHSALISGLIITPASKVDLSLLYRRISPQYQSLYANSFTQNTQVTNENGIYIGTTLRLHPQIRLDAFADLYQFPWLKFGVNSTSYGHTYFVKLNFRKNKRFDAYVQYRNKLQQTNSEAILSPIQPIQNNIYKNIRLHLNNVLTEKLQISSRIEFIKVLELTKAQTGTLFFIEGTYKLNKEIQVNGRILWVETDGFDSRLYAYEKDVAYYYTIPMFMGRQTKFYTNVQFTVNSNLKLWLKWAWQLKLDEPAIFGSGWDQIAAKNRHEIRLQAIYQLP